MSIIMLAEDDLTMVALLKTLLGMEGFEVVSVDLDEDVFTVVKDKKPDILILDVYLPKTNGLKVLDQIRENEETKDLIVIMTSGLNLAHECTEHGANYFLLKPYMPDELLDVIKKYPNHP